jgi:hypothetical protein
VNDDNDPVTPGYTDTERTYTRREWLTRHAILGGAPIFLAAEAVSSTAMEHPEWDMDGEQKTMAEWEMMESGP